MDINLIMYDIESFLTKYTRFMTKNIYISNSMYKRFMEQYQYLYQILKKEKYLYSDNQKYKKMMDIKNNSIKLVKLHNQKYLQKLRIQYQSFFKNLYKEELDVRKQNIILSEESNMLVIQEQNIIPLVVAKIKYLLAEKKYSAKNILVLTTTEKLTSLSVELKQKNIDIEPETFENYSRSFLKEKEAILTKNKTFDILIHYIMYQLFPNKKSFSNFYEAFSNYIYLNKDYKDYETFKDYHNYMYKRKFLASNLPLKKYNEQEIKKRRKYLRTIQNEEVNTKEEVDIANFLYLNSIPYHYNKDTSMFSIRLDNKKNQILFQKESSSLSSTKNTSKETTIYLYATYLDKTTYLEQLAYELIKLRYPMERLLEEDIYNRLKETTMENYFNELIWKYLIPTIEHYEYYHSLDNTYLTTNQKEEFLKVYSIYQQYSKEHHLVEEKELLKRISYNLENKTYQYIILIGDIPLQSNIPTLKIMNHYQETELVKENIKLLYDYKKYLYENQFIPIPHTYLGIEELNSLTTSFLKENLVLINQNLDKNQKEIEIYSYDDTKRLQIYKNIGLISQKVLATTGTNTLIAVEHLKDINHLIGEEYFSKIDKKTLLTKDKFKVHYEEITKIEKIQDCILFPFLIPDYYHEDLLKGKSYYHIKLMLYISLNKCRKKVIILCPQSRIQELSNILGNLKKVKNIA